ncbi:sugar phosphate nucleotidyltransferase [Frisingicoccus caecimuris]|uniref:mannose-1-phosphate guanylyltransferase n=1 Tax=Frisingicoccus caecimuris TaxID=1796636 RepID=A0A4R2LLN5_9FIRM|nr:mannose-1-phosphate guanylyltransferase [Frisingicoccus caecimuris]MCR1918780.1 sugar phosphate nucleotidyltransferase [Frisingicoccus caecimuris]TCO84407.1 mannose-1-phosphate guanylyltransferase [Frisingicoccus caecimuris]
MKKTALIMAGGKGERFWPKSRQSLPKQFLSLTNDGKTMIQLTVERILPLVSLEDIYIATNTNYKHLVLEQLPGIPAENILCEPVGRNTAPCIGLGAVHIQRKYEDAIMIVLPSDHLIKYNDIFTETLANACDVAEINANLVTIGITPNYPETGYGYIKADKNKQLKKTYSVERFVEKPDFNLAKTYVESGDYYWNSGMFIWKLSSILENMKNFMSDTYNGLLKIQAAIKTPEEENVLKNIFPEFVSDSIDYGIMEKASGIYLIPGNFGWDDVGSWLAVERVKGTDDAQNTLTGNVIALNTSHCTIEGKKRLIAALGLKDLIIVDTDDALLIADKNSAGDIKKILAVLRDTDRENYL